MSLNSLHTAPDLATADPYGTLADGIYTYIDSDGELQAIPNTGTPPFGEPVLNTELELEDPIAGAPVAPVDPPLALSAEEDFLHEQLHGAPWHGYHGDANVNPANPGIPNLGPVGEQPYMSAHTSALIHNSSAEQGWGLDPAILLPRYPQAQGVNPYYRNLGTHRRMGDLEYVPTAVPFGDLTQQNVQLQWQLRRRVSQSHGAQVDNPPPMSYAERVGHVPVHGQAGPLNLVPETDIGIY